MHTSSANGTARISFWPRVREFAVPPAMIENATARRELGDWGGACAAAGFDPEVDLRAVARTHGRETVRQIRSDLRHLAPDLLRWHLPRVAPDGLLRPGLTLTLARYPAAGPGPLHLVARTAPAWAEGGQRVELALWDGTLTDPAARRHPHPHPDRRFRLDLHRHLWDARRYAELGLRSGTLTAPLERWAAEAALLRTADGLPPDTPVAVRLSHRRHLLLSADGATGPLASTVGHPLLPDAATRLPPDVALLRAGRVDPDRLHPLVAAALAPGYRPPEPVRSEADAPLLIDCRGARHRIAVVDGVLTALDHDPVQLRREELLMALSGTPVPCLQAIDRAHRRPEDLDAIRLRLDHGDRVGALTAVHRLLGAAGPSREGPLADALAADTLRRIDHGLYRAGLSCSTPAPSAPDTRPNRRLTRPGSRDRHRARHAMPLR
ncbi:hypothetical protein AB0K51_25565 [Kitasatospora sp. NPDC049285]|uniref:hypothetical protein n=1 Tax=Kitasatospora sp. NPDC049285 TaxID=3157096 RepID=UPI0034496BA6